MNATFQIYSNKNYQHFCLQSNLEGILNFEF
jgi:hypothetical protein